MDHFPNQIPFPVQNQRPRGFAAEPLIGLVKPLLQVLCRDDFNKSLQKSDALINLWLDDGRKLGLFLVGGKGALGAIGEACECFPVHAKRPPPSIKGGAAFVGKEWGWFFLERSFHA